MGCSNASMSRCPGSTYWRAAKSLSKRNSQLPQAGALVGPPPARASAAVAAVPWWPPPARSARRGCPAVPPPARASAAVPLASTGPEVPAVAAGGIHRPEPILPGSGALFSRSTVRLVPLAPSPSVGSAAPRAWSAALAGPCWARRFWLPRSILGRVQGPRAAFPILQY